MTQTKSDESLKRFPAVRCHIGDWDYFLTNLPFSEIGRRVQRAARFLEPAGFDDLVQRELSNRISGITDYILGDSQRFFSAIVVGVRGGEPRWFPLEVEPNPLDNIPGLDERYKSSLGILELDESEELFAIDGQHRVEAIKRALKLDSELGDEEVAVIFVAAREDEDSVQRVRRLFSRLNRYAKPTTLGENIALDEDDCVAIVTRQLVREYFKFRPSGNDLFRQSHVIHFITADIPGDNSYSLTSLTALYDITAAVSWSRVKSLGRKLRHLRPHDSFLDALYSENVVFWDTLREKFPKIDRVVKAAPHEAAAAGQRTLAGGHILFRPIGLKAFVRAIAWAEQNFAIPFYVAMDALAKLPTEISEPPWETVMWDGRKIESGSAGFVEVLMLDALGLTGRGVTYNSRLKVEDRYKVILDDDEASLDSYRLENLLQPSAQTQD